MKNIIVENSLIKKEFILKSNRITGYSIYNSLSDSVISAKEGSEEFLICFKCGFRKQIVKASELRVEEVLVKENNDIREYRINFRAVNVRDSRILISLIYNVNDFRCYLRKHLELSYEKRGSKSIILDYIAFESLGFDSSLSFWTVPEQKKNVIPGFALSLGQPVYVDSLYMGCEFPVAINKVDNCCAKVMYYNGKDISSLIGGDKYISYKSVIGGSEGNVYQQVQKSFYEYIKDISKPVYLRRQYNSWFDNMLNITEKNITESFMEIEKGLTGSGEPELDSYVIDDGWNDYGKDFWSFNDRFPDELYPFSKLAGSFGSRFGLWLGPRGGYTNDTIKFARKIEKSGNGFVNKQAKDICVAGEKYSRMTGELLLDFQKRFDINYFKLDGFAQVPCKNKKHDHMTGGYKDIYFYNDIWEKWIKIFEKMSRSGDSKFWINLTCYAWPSPWFLQWVNSLWMQISLDVGFTGKKGTVSDKDRMLSYRDEVYLDFYQIRQLQFPQRAIYNHDPIYGNEAKVSMTDDEFREYLFTMAARGTQFWELYYSYKMMNEAKWRINYACLRFIEDNIDVLSNSVIFGGRPSENKVYGYSCFADHEGIICVRNSSNKAQDFSFCLNELIGVRKSFAYGDMYQILPYSTEGSKGAYSYGDTVKVSLEAYQTKIFHFGRRKKKTEITYIKALNKNTLEVQFNQTVCTENISCGDKTVRSVKLLEDYMTAVIELEEAFSKENTITLNNIADIMGNTDTVTADFNYYKDYIINEGGIKGKGDFTVEINLKDKAEGSLFRQGDEVEISVGEDKYIRFRVGKCTLKSDITCEGIVQITAVRERNNVLKLYLNKKLDTGMPSVACELSGKEYVNSDCVKVQVLDKALSFDEI